MDDPRLLLALAFGAACSALAYLSARRRVPTAPEVTAYMAGRPWQVQVLRDASVRVAFEVGPGVVSVTLAPPMARDLARVVLDLPLPDALGPGSLEVRGREDASAHGASGA